MISFNPVAKVGVAPSTTTLQVRQRQRLRTHIQGVQCLPSPSAEDRGQPFPTTAELAAAPRNRSYYPYATPGDFRSGLGLVDPRDGWWTGNEHGHLPGTTVIHQGGGRTSLLGLVDPRDGWWTGNEHGHLPGTTVIRYAGGQAQVMGGLGTVPGEINRSLTGLGTIPNDDELSTAYGGCYTPVHSGWIYGTTPEGKQYYAAGLYGANLGQVPVDQATAEELVKIQRKQLWLQGLSSVAIAAVAVSAVIGAVRASRK